MICFSPDGRSVPEVLETKHGFAAEFLFGRIFGTVKEAGKPDSPIERRVFLSPSANSSFGYGLYDAFRPFPTQAVFSNPSDGSFEFTGLNPILKYHVIAYDHTGQYDPVVKMNLVPTVD